MKRLPGVKETNIALNTVSLDLRSPAGKTGEGYFRLIVNALSERNGRLRRLGGWRALSLNKSADQNLTFAIVGDQGWGSQPEANVAAMIKTWNPSFIATVGDNIYGANTGMTLAQANALFASTNTAQYGDFIAAQKFFPSIGNHETDYDPGSGLNAAAPVWYRSKFPYAFQGGTKNYYRVHYNEGPVELFVISSGLRTDGTHFEPDGDTVGSVQYLWLRQALESSTAMFKVVIFHHSPYSRGNNYQPGLTHMRWNFGAMGADAVFSGHEHNYQRWLNQDIPYVVTGHGGAPLTGFYSLDQTVTTVDNPARYGAMRLTTEGYRLKVEAVMVDGTIFDTFYITKRNNEDLHDQLFTNFIFPAVPVDFPSYPVTGWGFDGSSPGTVTATTFTVEITEPTAEAGIVNGAEVEMPTISVVAPTTRSFVPYTNYKWRLPVKVLGAQINPPTQGWVEASYTSVVAGGTAIVKFYTVVGANLPVGANVYAYACAPMDAAQWNATDATDLIMAWDFNAQDNIFNTPTNTMVTCA